MKDNYDFSNAKRGAVAKSSGKTRISIMLDDDILAAFRERAAAEGKGYQTVINDTLRESLDHEHVTLEALRQVIREELRHPV
jgi:uncharacterized protein (DUF4415 family)